ncbi:helix-turn-helix transcriptional regulator [Endomicrobium proavitum]|uniref:Transcriptional regulator n=1 Tax=Endomicrobium proavitum TaxID=1408281 RepID=A0A0G3WIK2_9BACT|nr:transcriptional regulator [Endomicrobium proavitum]AKL98466.1 hypothetical protein Epro_1087 [Endomicrobium proavitum]
MANEILTKIKRLMYLINALDKGSIKLSKLALELSISPRTLQRDIKILELANFVIYSPEKGVYAFMEGHSLQRMQLDKKEAAMLALFSDISGSLGATFSKTYETLSKKLIQQKTENPFYIKLSKGHAYTANEVTKIIEKAVNDCEKIHISYEDSPDNPRPIEPLKIVLFDGFWYLLAFGDKRALLKLRLEKIISARPSGKYFKKSKNIAKILDESVSMWIENKRNIKAQLLISDYAAKYFKSKNFFPRQKVIKTYKNGSMLIQCTASTHTEIIHIILSWIPHIIVKSPKELVGLVEEKVKTYLKNIKA